MFLRLLKSKIHQATVTQTDLNYSGSVTIDQDLMDAVGLVNSEIVMVANLNNGNRFTTYAIPGERGSGIIGLNGAAARLVNKGDLILIFAFVYATEQEASEHSATVIILDEDNKIKEKLQY